MFGYFFISCVTFPNHEIVSHDRNCHGDGVALAIHKSIKFQFSVSVNNTTLSNIEKANSIEVTAAKLFLNNSKELCLFSVQSALQFESIYLKYFLDRLSQ